MSTWEACKMVIVKIMFLSLWMIVYAPSIVFIIKHVEWCLIWGMWSFYVHTIIENYAEKKSQLFFHCGSFDHHDLQSLNDYMAFSFPFFDYSMEFSGRLVHRCKGVFQGLSNNILQAPKFLTIQLVNQKKMQLFNKCRACWSKEPHRKNDCGFFLQCSLLILWHF